MASVPAFSDPDSADDSGEDEIFFGPMSDKEAKIARRLMKRKTELFIASRPSLEEFRRNNNFMLDAEDESLSKSNEEFADSLDEASVNSSSICSDSGIDIKPCAVTEETENFQHGLSTVRDSSCSQSTTYYSATSEVDNHAACMEDSLNNVDTISSDTATYYSGTSEAEHHIAYLEDSLNSIDRFSLASRIDQARTSMEVHARRQSSICISESSFEQDSYSMAENVLEKQMELLDIKEDKADAVSASVSQEIPELNYHPDNSPHSSKSCESVDAVEGNFIGMYDQREHPAEDDLADSCFSPSPKSDIDQQLPSRKYSVLQAPPSSPELMRKNLLSEENDERSVAAVDEITSFQTSPATSPKFIVQVGDSDDSLQSDATAGRGDALKTKSDFVTFTFSPAKHFMSVLNFKKLFTSPLMASCIAKSSASSDGECFEENSTLLKQVVSDIADGSPRHECLRELVEPTEPCNVGSENLESCDMLLENECSAEDEILTSVSLHTDLNTEKPSAKSPTTISKDAEVQSRCLMVDHATSICQSEENTIDAKDQGCQTSFLGNTEKVPVASALDIACGPMPSWEVQSQKRCTPLSSQKPQRIAVCRTIGQPGRLPIFKTPTKPPMRVLTPSSSKSKQIAIHKTPEDGNKLTIQIKSRFDHIVSPVAKYIKEFVPPLISNSKPIMARGTKLGTTPKTRIPVPSSSSGKKLPFAGVSSANKRILAPFGKIPTAHRPVPKAKTKLNFVHGAGEDAKENFSIEDSIFEELKITLEDLNEINNKKLKKDIRDYVRTRKAMIVNAAKDESTNLIVGSSRKDDAAPSVSYKGASCLATKQVDLLTQIHTVKNKNVICSPGQRTVLKHTGERKVLHWADGLLSEVNAPSSPLHHKFIAPTILMKNAHKKSSQGSRSSNSSVVDVSIVEIVNPMRSNTLAKK